MGKLIGRFVIIGGVAVVGVAVIFMLFAKAFYLVKLEFFKAKMD